MGESFRGGKGNGNPACGGRVQRLLKDLAGGRESCRVLRGTRNPAGFGGAQGGILQGSRVLGVLQDLAGCKILQDFAEWRESCME